jgi:pectate lyase
MPKRWVMCNPASQQILYRVFDALTELTGDPKYHQVAADAMAYAMKHFAYDDGLLFWGGHAMIDLATATAVGESHKDWSKTPTVPVPADWDTGVVHELKYHYPYYELMRQVDPEATQRFVLAFWATHVQNWRTLDMNRHGIYGRHAGLSWDHEYEGGPVPFKGKGLSFIHTGSDLIYAAVLLSEFTGDEGPFVWAKRLAARYDEIRHPRTGLAADVYNYYRNERVLAQFGPEFGDRVTETTIASLYGGRYGHPAIWPWPT